MKATITKLNHRTVEVSYREGTARLRLVKSGLEGRPVAVMVVGPRGGIASSFLCHADDLERALQALAALEKGKGE